MFKRTHFLNYFINLEMVLSQNQLQDNELYCYLTDERNLLRQASETVPA